MSLQKKVLLLVSVTFIVYGVIATGIQHLFILPSFYDLEQEESLKNMDRAVEAIEREIQILDASVKDWAFWNDTYQYAQDQNEGYVEANLNELTLDGLGVNLLYVYDASQQLLCGMVYDLENQEFLTIPEIGEQLVGIRLDGVESFADGILLTSFGPMLISARPILTSDRQGPAKGTFIFGRFINTSDIAGQVRINLNVTVLDQTGQDIETAAIITEIDSTGEPLIRQEGETNRVYEVLPDVFENPALLLQVNVPRLIAARGERATQFAMYSMFGASLVIVAVLIIGLRRMVLNPLKRLTTHMVEVGQGDHLFTPLDLNRKDEFGTLGQEYDGMVERLETTRKSLVEQSYHSGMAEVATGILHNVGNVLNSVNVSSTLLLDQIRASRIGNVSRVAAMIADPGGDLGHFLTEDPRGKQIPAYLSSLAAALQDEQQLMLKETRSLQSQIEHIKEIVTMQQNYSRVSHVDETTSPEQLMEDALKINDEAFVRHAIHVCREYQAVPPIKADKHKILQILLNLISNAKYACAESRAAEKTITVRVFRPNENYLKMQVADNGTGILSENITRIFQYGFTTRKSGHGFGLHSSALAAHEIGGSLTAHSDGIDRGATFTLELPYTSRGK